jgi:hypothetical protein
MTRSQMSFIRDEEVASQDPGCPGFEELSSREVAALWRGVESGLL